MKKESFCICETRHYCPDEPFSEFCVDCRRIWVHNLCGGMNKTERFARTYLPLQHVWVGHVGVKGPIANAIKQINTINAL